MNLWRHDDLVSAEEVWRQNHLFQRTDSSISFAWTFSGTHYIKVGLLKKMAFLRNFSLIGGPPPPYFGNISKKKCQFFWVLPWEKILKILQVAKDKCKLCTVPTRKACWSHPQIAIWNCFANTQAVLLQTHRTLRVSEFHWCIFLSQQDLNLFLIPPEWKGRKNMCLSQAIRKGKKTNLSPRSLLNI